MTRNPMLIKAMSVYNQEELIYNLIFKNAFYSLECFKKGKCKENLLNYCFVENITDDEGEAEFFFKIVTKGKVLPVHIEEVAKDYLAAYK